MKRTDLEHIKNSIKIKKRCENMENRKLKELYDYDMITEEGGIEIANEWFNVLMEKNVYDLTLADICRMLRQKIFSVVAIDRAIDILNEDLFAGDFYEGQLLVNLCNAKEKYLSKRYDDVEPLLDKAIRLALSNNWQDDEVKKDYIESAVGLKEKIRNRVGV